MFCTQLYNRKCIWQPPMCMYGVWGSGIKLSYIFGKFIFTYEIYSTKRNRKNYEY